MTRLPMDDTRLLGTDESSTRVSITLSRNLTGNEQTSGSFRLAGARQFRAHASPAHTNTSQVATKPPAVASSKLASAHQLESQEKFIIVRASQ